MNKKESILIELIVAFFLTFKIINYSLVTITNSINTGYLNVLFYICGILFIFVTIIDFLKNNKKKQKTVDISFKSIIFTIVVIALYIISIEKTNISIAEFIIYFFLSFIIGTKQNWNIERILLLIMIFSTIALLCFNKIFEVKWYGSVTMDISYAFLPTVVAALLHFTYYFREKKKKLFLIILYCINTFYLFQLILYGERGTVICILMALIFCINIKYDIKNNKIIKKNLNTKFIITAIIGIIAIILYKDILKIIVNLTGINSYSINKFLTLSTNDVSNGRFALYSTALNGFLESPIFGKGISSFNYFNPGGGYPHNIFFQILYDGGLILFLPYIYILIAGTINVFKSEKRDLVVLWIYFFSTAIMYLMFSNNIWLLPALWIYIGFLSINVKKKIEEN